MTILDAAAGAVTLPISALLSLVGVVLTGLGIWTAFVKRMAQKEGALEALRSENAERKAEIEKVAGRIRELELALARETKS